MNIHMAQREILGTLWKTPEKVMIIDNASRDGILIALDDNRGYCIPPEQCWIDCEKIKRHSDFNKLFNLGSDPFINELRITQDIQPNDKFKKLRCLINSSALRDTWVVDSYLKNYDLDRAHFYQKKESGPILIFEDGKMVGLVMSVRMRDAE